MMVVGTGISVMGQLQAASGARAAGKQALKTAEYNKSIRDRNARVAGQEADLRDRVNERQEFRSREQFAKLQARGRTAYAKRGVVASSGTPLAVLMDNANKFEEDIELDRLQGATESGRIRESATNQRLAGQLALLEGGSRKMAADIQARGHMFSALTSAAKGAYQYSQIT
jgi:hypothetical protein